MLRTLATVIAIGLAAPAAAHANRMSMFKEHGKLYFRYYGSRGEANQLTITSYPAGNQYCAGGPDDGFSHKPCYFVTDPAAAGHVNAGGYCHALDPTYPGEAECDFGGPAHVADDHTVHMSIYLGDRNDTVTLSTGVADALISGGDGNDTLGTLGAAKFTLLGGNGNDTLVAVNHDDVLGGGPGDDTLFEPANCSHALLDGGPGTDTVAANPLCLAGIHLNLSPGHALHAIENATGAGGADVIYGTAGPNVLSGGGGDDTIYGYQGNDTIDGGPGKDTLHGGTGDDTINGGEGNDTLTGDKGDDKLTDQSGSLYGGAGNDTLVAGMNFDAFGGGNLLAGGDGNDVLQCGHVGCAAIGGPGNDHVMGSDDPERGDTLIAGPGADTYDGNGGPSSGGPASCVEWSCWMPGFQPDVLTYRGYTQGVNVTLDGVANDGAPGEHDNVFRIGAVIGTNFNDRITGAPSPAMMLIGGDGNDALTGGNGPDVLDGGPGDDVLTGGPGKDTFACGLGSDRVTDPEPAETQVACAP